MLARRSASAVRSWHVETSALSATLNARSGPLRAPNGGNMDPKLQPIPIGDNRASLAADGFDAGRPAATACCATPTGCSRCRCCRSSPARFVGMAAQLHRALQGGADHDAAADVRRDDGHAVRRHALRNSAWGVAALFGFTFVSGVFLTPILTVAAGFRNGGQLVALAGGMTAAIFFALATIATVTKRDFSLPGQVPVHRHDPADRRVARQPVLPGAGGVADDLGDRGADLLGLPAARRQPDRATAARPTT